MSSDQARRLHLQFRYNVTCPTKPTLRAALEISKGSTEESISYAITPGFLALLGSEVMISDPRNGGIFSRLTSLVASTSPSACLEFMMVQRAGAIVNTASIAGLRSSAAGQAYSATKAAMINFSQTCAVDLAEWNIRVNAVCPGLTATGMTKALFDSAKELGREAELESRAPLGRSGTPDDIASAIAFLASDEAGFITGQYLAIDGGKSATMGQFDSGNRSDQLPCTA